MIVPCLKRNKILLFSGGNNEDKDESKSNQSTNQITTTADVEVNHRSSDGEIEEGEQLWYRLREETDSDLSPENNFPICKRRKAVRRTKSSLESSTMTKIDHIDIDEIRANMHMSLPPNQRFSMEKSRNAPKKDEDEVIYRGHRDSNIKRRGLVISVDEPVERAYRMGTPIPESHPVYHTLPDAKEQRRSIKCNRSYSVDEAYNRERESVRTKDKSLQTEIMHNIIAKKSNRHSSDLKTDVQSEVLDVTDTNAHCDQQSKSSELVSKSDHTRNGSDMSDISLGEIRPEVSKMRSKTKKKKKTRPCSVGDLDKKHLDKPIVEPAASSSKDFSLTHRVTRFLQGGGSSTAEDGNGMSQQSSTVGLDWLFSTDSDSVSSGEGNLLYRISSLSCINLV